MISVWMLLALIAVFFTREVYLSSKQKPTDFDSGYHQAIIDVCTKWNAVNHETKDYKEHCSRMKKYLQSELDGR